MKSNISKITSLLMALLVLLSTVSFTVEKHFCGDFLVDISYFGDSDGCGDELDNDNCDSPQKIEKDNCCKNELEKIEGQDDLQKESLAKITLKKQQFVIAFLTSYYNLFRTFPNQVIPHKDYSPPNLTTNIQVLHEVFII